MNVIIQIQGREAIPVRAIPFLTYWQTMTPDALALALAGDEHFYRFEHMQAHRAIDAKPLRHQWWVSNVLRPHRALSDKLQATEISHETGLENFRTESLKMLPAGVYVWRDEFERAHQRHYSGTALPVDCDDNVMQLTDSELAKLTATHQERIALDFSPLIATELYALVMDGFPAPQDAAPAQGIATPEPVAEIAIDDEAWQTKARGRAIEIIERQRKGDLYPNQIDVADEIAKEFRGTIVGAAGKPLSGAYIKRHALHGISSAKGKQLSTRTGRGK